MVVLRCNLVPLTLDCNCKMLAVHFGMLVYSKTISMTIVGMYGSERAAERPAGAFLASGRRSPVPTNDRLGQKSNHYYSPFEATRPTW